MNDQTAANTVTLEQIKNKTKETRVIVYYYFYSRWFNVAMSLSCPCHRLVS